MALLRSGAVAHLRCCIVALLLLRSDAVAQWHYCSVVLLRGVVKKRGRGVVLSIEMN